MPTSSFVGRTSTVTGEPGAEKTPSPRSARLASGSNETPRQESRFPGLPYVIFPGNVGAEDDLRRIAETLIGV